MERIKFLLLFLVITLAELLAAGNQRAILFYKVGLPESARNMLQKNLQSSAENKAEVCFYLGKIALASQQPDSAAYYFSKGKEYDSEYVFNTIGEGQLLLPKDKGGARSVFDKALSGKHKKDPLIHLAIARAYLECNQPDYRSIVEELKQDYDKVAAVYVFEGDALLFEKKYGEALTQYEQAIYFEPGCEEAYVKYAQAYREMNPGLALEMLRKLLAVNPASEIAYREMGEVAFAGGDFAEAARNYDKYFSFDVLPSAQEVGRYATILFYGNQYDKALQYIERGLASEPNNLVLNRIKMYIFATGTCTDEQLAHAAGFMEKFPAGEYISLDYLFYGNLLKNGKRYEEASRQFRKVIELDPERGEAYRNLADVYELMNQYPEAIAAYRGLFEKNKSAVELSDYLTLGKEYYFAADALKGTADSLDRTAFLVTADSLFAVVADKSPSNCLGYFWRARALSMIDYDTTRGLAKPYYEKTLSILEPEGKDKKKIIECYNYLGFYYYVASDFPNSLTYWNKTIAIDPENEVAKRAIEGIGGEMKTPARK